jgi:hypothetical protein
MKRLSLRLLAVPGCVLLISGCGSMATKPAITYGTQSVAGDWTFSAIDDFKNQSPFEGLSGGLAGQGNTITGILRTSGGCVSSTQDINFTGTEDATGNVTLTSTNLPNNVATISGLLGIPGDGVPYLSSGLVVTGSGPCAGSFAGFLGNELPLLSGAYTASLTSTAGATATLTASFTAGAANAEFQFPETATATLSSASCSSTISLNGMAAGLYVNGTMSEAPTSGNNFTVALASRAITINNTGAACNSGTFSGNLATPQ